MNVWLVALVIALLLRYHWYAKNPGVALRILPLTLIMGIGGAGNTVTGIEAE